MHRYRSTLLLVLTLVVVAAVGAYLIANIVDVEEASDDRGAALAQVASGGMVVAAWLTFAVPLSVLLYLAWMKERRGR